MHAPNHILIQSNMRTKPFYKCIQTWIITDHFHSKKNLMCEQMSWCGLCGDLALNN